MSDRKRRVLLIALIAVVLGMMGFIYASIPQDIAFEIVKNNTDLCDFNHTTNLCNGIRQSNVTYYTNNTSIVLYVFAHANLASQTAGVFLYRDDVLIEAQAGRPLAAPEQTWRGITAIIPKNSSYRVNFTDYHHFEWYEDQILSGRNGTLSINQTIIGGAGCTGDCAFNNITVNSIGKNDTSYSMFINLTSPFQHYLASQDIQNFIFMNESDGGISSMHFVSQNLTDGEHSEFFMSPYRFFWFNGNGGSRTMEFTPAGIDMIINGTADYHFNQTHFNMGGANLTGCSNCGGNQNLSQVLSVGNEGNNQSVNNISNLNMTGKLMINTTTAFTGAGYTLMNMGRTSSPSKFRATLNDANGAFNFRVNVKDDLTQDIPTGSGWSFAMQPASHKFGVTTIYPGTTNAYNPFSIWSNASVYPQGRIQLGDPATTTKQQYQTQIYNLSLAGTGNYSLIVADSEGILWAVPMNGSGNHYICANQAGLPFPGTPGC